MNHLPTSRLWVLPAALLLLPITSGCRSVEPGATRSRQPPQEAGRTVPSWAPPPCQCQYEFPHAEDADPLWKRVPAPGGYRRVPVQPESFACWLRGLPLKPEGAPVLLFDGTRKANQAAHAAVVDLDVGDQNLQQCADALLRLRAEYLFSCRLDAQISFTATNGQPLAYARWKRGERPSLQGNRIAWRNAGGADRSWTSFRKYLDFVFSYAGTISLKRDTEPVDVEEVKAGDMLVEAGSPGHAVMVVDVCEETDGTGKLGLLAQSFMPAQSIHVLRNYGAPRLSPWYDLGAGESVETPMWEFRASDTRRFR